MTSTLFGTDGIRGKAGQEPLTTPTMERLGRVLAERLLAGQGASDSSSTALIGHDGRESGEILAAALAQGLNAGGVSVDVLGLTTTPCTAYLTCAGDYAAGIMVSASHNPASDNGIKLLGADGHKLGDTHEADLEAALLEGPQLDAVETPGVTRRSKGLLADYVGWLRSEAFPDLDLRGQRILVDCANGGASQLAGRVIKAFGGEPHLIHDRPDGRNINEGCGALYPQRVALEMAAQKCTLGLSLDGDGDRGMLADGTGRVLDGDAILAGIGKLLAAAGELPANTVVATVMSNLALERFLEAAGVKLVRTQVGDRHVASAMRQHGYHLGGEKSGHILYGPEHGFRGDGLYTLLKVAATLQAAGGAPTDFAAGYQDLPQELLNLPATRRVPLEELPQLSAAMAALEQELGEGGRIVVRFSGTELKLRLMVEAESEERVAESIAKLRQAATADGILA